MRVARLLLSVAFVVPTLHAWSAPKGETVYKQQCAVCHGPAGQGTDSYPEPLIGDKSVGELTALITKTMPEGTPDDCVGQDAQDVAQYIHQAFYSPVAQERNRPARIELSRLTRTQYENATADLIRSFRGWGEWDDKRGLKAEYYTGRHHRRDKRKIERTEPVVDVDFGQESPLKDQIDPKEFAIKWEGSIFAPDTGDYEFVLHTANGARLWLNDSRNQLIDAWVRSGPATDYRATIKLLGGRAYYLRVETFKFRDDSFKLSLRWIPPNGVEEVVPARYLGPNLHSKAFVLTTNFPPDDRSMGFERGNSVSREWVEAATYASLETALYVVENVSEMADAKGDKDREKKLREFAGAFVERAFRRPLTDAEKTVYIEQQFNEAKDPEVAVKRVVLLALQSPYFLYREVPEGGKLDQHDLAAWLAFTLWDSIPDNQLADAAKRGHLSKRDEVARHVDRMLKDGRARAKLRGFFHQWLHVAHGKEIVKDSEKYPGFTEPLIADLRQSLEMTVEDIFWSQNSDYRQLFKSDDVYFNGRLAKFYGVNLPESGDFQKVLFEPQHRAGVLTHPYLMADFAYDTTTSPIHRGVFLARDVLGRVLMPPATSVTPVPPELHPGLSTRERVDLQTSPAGCVRCHSLINGLGFSLENFDTVGKFRTQEQGKPIDARGMYRTAYDEEVRFEGADALSDYLANSSEAHAAFVKRLFHYMIKQSIRSYGDDMQARLAKSFADHGFNMRHLVNDMVTESALALMKKSNAQ